MTATAMVGGLGGEDGWRDADEKGKEEGGSPLSACPHPNPSLAPLSSSRRGSPAAHLLSLLRLLSGEVVASPPAPRSQPPSPRTPARCTKQPGGGG